MLTEIEKLLETKTLGKKSHVFFTQWQVAKDYVPQVLNTISQVFPHYSLHDRTHSETIIYNIGRILGLKTLEKMSSIDLWLMLSAAFYHDVGMVVYSNEKIDFFQNEEFIEFLKYNQLEETSSLHDYSKCFYINDKDNKVHYKDELLSAQNYDAARFLLAEFVRNKHGKRANDSMHSDISINLPGSPIPKRIIDVLGNICYAHTQSFDKVMELPFCEAGIDLENCHPRYIACLLRLGDLLDIDNNRFSEVLLQTLPSIPIDSIWHKDKHMSIKHLQINETKIEARAECDDYDVADITNRWFSMIDSEMYNQMKNWNDIVPDASYGFLPTLGKLDVVLKGYDTINGKERPSFKIDSAKAIELLQGAGLYNEPHQCVRELLQNSVDATILRVFVESEQNGLPVANKDDFYKRCKNHPIKVSIKKEKVEQNSIDWSIRISDCGIGMSRGDLLFLTTTGGSNNNTEKRKIIERMPEWMRPSGTFGIGFQSVFLLTDTVKVETRKWNKEDVLNVTLYNPAGKNRGSVLIQTVGDKGKKKAFGTDVAFGITRKSIPDRIPFTRYNKWANQVRWKYDFVNGDSFDIDIALLIDEVYKFAYASYIPIYIKLDNQNEVIFNKNDDKYFQYFVEEQGLELSISRGKDLSMPCAGTHSKCYTFYRNQIVTHADFGFRFLTIQVNILSGDAKEMLTLNRNEIRSDYRSLLWDKILNAIFDVLSNHFNEFDVELRQYASMFINYYSRNDERKKALFDNNLPNDWKDFVVTDMNKKTMKELINYGTILLRKEDMLQMHKRFEELNNNTLVLYRADEELSAFVLCNTKNNRLRFYYSEDEGKCVELLRGKSEVLIDNWKRWFYLYSKDTLFSRKTARSLMPCTNRYIALRIKNITIFEEEDDFTFSVIDQSYPKMICPYIRVYNENEPYQDYCKLKVSVSEKLYQFVYDNRFDESVTLKKIEDTYKEFLKDMEHSVQDLLEENN